jgi:hypothetical protein
MQIYCIFFEVGTLFLKWPIVCMNLGLETVKVLYNVGCMPMFFGSEAWRLKKRDEKAYRKAI